MARGDETPDPGQSDNQDFVPVIVARSLDNAEMFRELLEDHDIPSILGTEEDFPGAADGAEEDEDSSNTAMIQGVPVLVPEGLLDEAGEIIADREDFEDLDDEEDVDEEDEKVSLNDGMIEEIDPTLADEGPLDDEDANDVSDTNNLDDEDDNEYD